MIFPLIICSLPLNKVARIELSLANLQLFTRVPTFSIFSSFSSQETVNVLFFSLLRNFITRLNLKFLPKLRKNYKKHRISWTTGSHCTLMADSIRVTQPIRLQHLH